MFTYVYRPQVGASRDKGGTDVCRLLSPCLFLLLELLTQRVPGPRLPAGMPGIPISSINLPLVTELQLYCRDGQLLSSLAKLAQAYQMLIRTSRLSSLSSDSWKTASESPAYPEDSKYWTTSPSTHQHAVVEQTASVSGRRTPCPNKERQSSAASIRRRSSTARSRTIAQAKIESDSERGHIHTVEIRIGRPGSRSRPILTAPIVQPLCRHVQLKDWHIDTKQEWAASNLAQPLESD